MKTKYKFIILVLLTIITSILIYNYVESFTIVDTESDILSYQVDKENGMLSNTDFSIENPNVILNPYDISPLTALVVFETSDLTSVMVTVKGKNENDITHTFIPSRVHILPIYGLYPDYENTIIITAGKITKELKIKTGALPENIKNGEKINALDTNELFFTTSDDIKGYPVAYDNEGNVRWYLTQSYNWDLTRLNNGHLLLSDDTLVNTPNYTTALKEIDLLGKIYAEYYLKGGYHHDVFELASGNLLVASNNFESGTVEDYIVEIDRTSGSIIKEFDLYDLMPNDEGYNWLGLNSLNYDPRTNSIFITGSKKDLIINIDYTSGEINWIIGEEKNVPSKYRKYLLEPQNKVDYPKNPESLILLDNNMVAFISHNDNNRLIKYKIDFGNRDFTMTDNIDLNTKSKIASLSQAENGLIVSNENNIQIVNEEPEELLKLNNDIYTAKLYNVYDADIFIAGRGQRLGSIGTTKTTKNSTVIFSKVDDTVFDKYNLSLYKDVNRLVVKGTFKKSDKVQIILDNVLDKKTYDVKVAETPYLIDDNNPDNKKIDIETYINEEELAGKYYIYIKINDTIYKLHKYVNFW